MGGRLPDFVVIGAMKCGTSTLHAQLATRAGLFLSDPKEPNFFSDDEQFARGREWYAGLFAAADAGQRCGESSTHYTKRSTHPHTVERMRRLLPKVRLVYLMRDPIDRIVSQYIHEWTERDLEGSLDAAVRRHDRLVDYSLYAHQLEPFLESYGADAVLPVFFERMLAQPDAELSRVCRFVGDPTPGPAGWARDLPAQNVSTERLRRSALREGLAAFAPARALLDRLPPSLRERLKAVWRLRERPAPSPALRGELEARIDADLQRLGAWLGRELRTRDWSACVRGGEPPEWVAPPARRP